MRAGNGVWSRRHGITMRERVDEITGMSQWVVTDSPDEKRVPQIIVRPAGGSRADEKSAGVGDCASSRANSGSPGIVAGECATI